MVTELVKLNECCLCKSTIANKTMTKTWPLEKNYSPIKNAATELQIICNIYKMRRNDFLDGNGLVVSEITKRC